MINFPFFRPATITNSEDLVNLSSPLREASPRPEVRMVAPSHRPPSGLVTNNSTNRKSVSIILPEEIVGWPQHHGFVHRCDKNQPLIWKVSIRWKKILFSIIKWLFLLSISKKKSQSRIFQSSIKNTLNRFLYLIKLKRRNICKFQFTNNQKEYLYKSNLPGLWFLSYFSV